MGLIWESFATEVFTILIIIAVYVYIDFKRSFTYWKRKDVPYLPPSFPFGNVNYNLYDYFGIMAANIYKELKQTNAKYGGMYVLKCPIFVSIHPNINKWILLKDFDSFPDRGFYYDEKNDPMTAVLTNVQGEKWHYLRTTFNPAFTPSKMKGMTSGIVGSSVRIQPILENAVRHSLPIDVRDITTRYTIDVIGSCAFGVDYNSLENPEEEFRKHAVLFLDGSLLDVVRMVLGIVAPNVLRKFKIPFFNPTLSSFFSNAFRNTMEFREQHGIVKNDIMSLLIRLKNNKSIDDQGDNANRVSTKFAGQLTINDVVAQALIFFIAGYETSANAMAFCMYELAVNPHVQEKLRREIHVVLSKHDGEITYDAIMEMAYLDKVINETLRKYPSVVMLNRRCDKVCQVPDSDVTIEKDTLVIIPVLGLHYDPEYYPDPDIFDPERFCEEEVKKRPKYTYLPFGAGPRSCIGLRFGLLESKIGIITFLKNYKYTLNPKTVTPVHIITKANLIRPKDKMWLDVQKI